MITKGETFILVDEEQLARDLILNRKKLPFLEQEGKYWGAPSDDEIAISELERLRQAGAKYIVFIWATFWWLDYYQEFAKYLHKRYHCLEENEYCIIFRLY